MFCQIFKGSVQTHWSLSKLSWNIWGKILKDTIKTHSISKQKFLNRCWIRLPFSNENWFLMYFSCVMSHHGLSVQKLYPLPHNTHPHLFLFISKITHTYQNEVCPHFLGPFQCFVLQVNEMFEAFFRPISWWRLILVSSRLRIKFKINAMIGAWCSIDPFLEYFNAAIFIVVGSNPEK